MQKNIDKAKIHLIIGGVDVGNLDGYNGSAIYNTVQTITGITISTSGLVTVSLKASDKNASSSGYSIMVATMALFRTA
jgi:hypothetical protein